MLLELNINNFAIIKDLNVQFTEGLNLLTGETGSGKSIIIEALGIILGGRGTKDLIRSGEDKAILQAVFLINKNDKAWKLLEDYGVHIDKDGILILSREIVQEGPNISRINGKTVTLTILNRISGTLVDIFAQQEHQFLLNISNHRILIDSFGDDEFNKIKVEIKSLYNNYIRLKKSLDEMNMDSNQRNREIDLLKFQINEIDMANLNDDEEELENEYKRLSNIKDIIIGVSKINEAFSNDDYNSSSVLDSLNTSITILNGLTDYDNSLKTYLERLENINFEIRDIDNDLKNYLSRTDVDEEKLFFLHERIDLINKLKKKYGNTIDEIISYKNKISKDLDLLLNYSEEIANKKKELKELEEGLIKESIKLSSLRKNIALSLEERISKELSTLNMDHVNFKVDFKENENPGPEGMDYVEFLISTNPGEELKSLTRIVSGGEMSRIMLGFKRIFAEHDKIPTLIFDEIDTGISGRTAQIVGEKIHEIAKKHQVISVSHLPQIAALADSHYVIYKELNKLGKMTTSIRKLNEDERITELARLLGGVNVTDITLNHAKEMLEMSKKI